MRQHQLSRPPGSDPRDRTARRSSAHPQTAAPPLVHIRPTAFEVSLLLVCRATTPRLDKMPSPHPRKRAPRPLRRPRTPLPAARGSRSAARASPLHYPPQKSPTPKATGPTPLILPQHTRRPRVWLFRSWDRSSPPIPPSSLFALLTACALLDCSRARRRAAPRPSLLKVGGRGRAARGARGGGHWGCSAASGLRHVVVSLRG